MRIVVPTSRFKKDLRRQLKRGKDREKLLRIVEEISVRGTPAPRYLPHLLQGVWEGTHECHIENDWLLIYTVAGSCITLHRTGTHDDLFD